MVEVSELARTMYTAYVTEHGYPNGLPTWDELPDRIERRIDILTKQMWLGMAEFCEQASAHHRTSNSASSDAVEAKPVAWRYHYEGDEGGARFQTYEGMSCIEEDQGMIETPLYAQALSGKSSAMREAWLRRTGTVEVSGDGLPHLKIYFESMDDVRSFGDAIRAALNGEKS